MTKASKASMEEYLADLSTEEIKEAIFTLAEKYFSVMEDADKQAFVIRLVGGAGDEKLSSMVSRWIAACMDEGIDPKNLCRRMVTAIDEHAELESLADPEIRALFVDWMEELEMEVLDYQREGERPNPEEMAEHFGISRQGAAFLLEKMKREGKLE